MIQEHMIYEELDSDKGRNSSVAGDKVCVFSKVVNRHHDCVESLGVGKLHNEVGRDGGPGIISFLWGY